MKLTSLIACASVVLLVTGCNVFNRRIAPSPTPGVVSFQPPSVSQSPCLGVADPTTAITPSQTRQWSKAEQVIVPTHTYCAIIKTDKGRIVAQLYAPVAPQNVNSFVFLANQGYYDNLTWHRVIGGFMAQTGDPTGTGMGGPGYNTPLETHPNVKYDKEGVVGVARARDPNSAGSQFFITYGPQPALDPFSSQLPDSPGYTIIGQVVEGMNVLRAIRERDPDQNPNYTGDPLVSIRIVDLGVK